MNQKQENRRIYPLSEVDPADTRTEIFCGLTKMVLLYFSDRYGQRKMEDFVYKTRMNVDYALDRTNWVSLKYIYRLLDALVEYTGDPQSAFEAGTYSCRGKYLGPLALACARFFSVAGAYRFITQSSHLWSKANVWKLESVSHQSCVISVQNTTIPQNKNNCLCIQGTLAALPRLHDLPRAVVVETQCACNGADRCVYHIEWQHGSPVRKFTLFFVFAALSATIVLLLQGLHPTSLVIALTFLIAGFLLDRLRTMHHKLIRALDHTEEQASALLEDMQVIERANSELQQKVERRTSQLHEKNLALKTALMDLQISQKQTLEIQRQAAIGALAAGTAHEMNSPLNGILLSIQALKEELPPQSDLYPVVLNAERASKRCGRIVKELLSFSRNPQKLEQLSLENIVKTTTAIFRKEYQTRLDIIEQYDSNLPELCLDRAQIQQALLNLLCNANDAMGGTGEVRLSLYLSPDKKGLFLSVKDKGPGIPEDQISHIFEPFYSTKHKNHGLGLGLSITHQLITKNGGTISVTSNPSEGTVFSIYFAIEHQQDGTRIPSRGKHHA